MRADFTPPPPDRSKDHGYVDVTENTMPSADQLAKARAEVNAHKLAVRTVKEAQRINESRAWRDPLAAAAAARYREDAE